MEFYLFDLVFDFISHGFILFHEVFCFILPGIFVVLRGILRGILFSVVIHFPWYLYLTWYFISFYMVLLFISCGI
jgi:hypothetical protein